MAGEVDMLAARFSRRLKKHNSIVTVAESCTGGLLASTLTDISGASKWFEQGWILYSNNAKENLLGVDKQVLDDKGAVNEIVAEQMSKGALERTNADISIAITGIAGPKSDDSIKEVGLVYVSVSAKNTPKSCTKEAKFSGGRHENKLAFVIFALRLAIEFWDELREEEEDSEDSETPEETSSEEILDEDMTESQKESEKNVDDPWGGNLGPEWKKQISEEYDSDLSETQPTSFNTDDVEWEEN